MTNLHFDFMIDDYMLFCMSKDLAQKTMKSYEQTLKLFQLYMKYEHKIEEVDKVTKNHIRQYINYLKKRGKYTVQFNSKDINKPENRTDRGKSLSNTTINNYLRNIKVFFNFLEDERIIKDNPTTSIDFLKKKQQVKKPLTQYEVRKLMLYFDTTTLHGYRDYTITRLMLMTGSRASETLALENDDVDFRTNTITFRDTKNKNEKISYLNNKMAYELRRWIGYKERYLTTDYLFPTIRGTKLSIQNFNTNLKKVARDAGVKGIHTHRLRHTFACEFLKNGGSIYVLSKLLDHSSVQVTECYLGLSHEDLRNEYLKHNPVDLMWGGGR